MAYIILQTTNHFKKSSEAHLCKGNGKRKHLSLFARMLVCIRHQVTEISWNPDNIIAEIHCYAIKNKNRSHWIDKVKNLEYDRWLV